MWVRILPRAPNQIIFTFFHFCLDISQNGSIMDLVTMIKGDEMDIDSMIDERKIDNMIEEEVMEKELIGFINIDMSDEEVLAMIDEIEAEEAAREELFDHFANEGI